MVKYPLKSLLTIKNGRDYRHLENGTIPVFGTGGIMCYVNEAISTKESILLPRKGSLNNVIYVDEPFWSVDTIFWTEINTEIADPYYLYSYLKLLDFNKLDVGSAVPSMTTSIYYMLELDLPELPVQKIIGGFLKKISNKININNKIINELESLAKTLYDYWFLQFEFPDANGKPYKSSGGRMVWNEELKREVPEGWGVKELEDCLSLIIDHRGKTPKKLGGDWVENGIIALSAKIVKCGKLLNLSEANQVSQEMFEKWMPEKLQDGDILMTSEAPLGEFYFMLIDTNYCLSQRLFALRTNPDILYPLYLYFELSEGRGYSQIMGKQSGSTVFGIRQDELRRVKVLVPEKNIQKKYNDVVLPIFRKIRTIDAENRDLAALRDFLLPMLMNGQVGFKE